MSSSNNQELGVTSTTAAPAAESETAETVNHTKKSLLFRAKSFVRTHPLPECDGDVCIVTGGTTGIGRATCEAFVKAGAIVYNLDISKPGTIEQQVDEGDNRKEEEKKESQEKEDHEYKERLFFLQCDVSKPDQIKAAVKQIFEKEGRITHLVSNAGVWVGGVPMESITEEEFDRVVGINVKGCFFAISSVVPYMREQDEGGSIVVVGSDQSLIGKPFQNLYGMTKGAIAQLAKSTAVQYAPFGIRCNCVCPGTIDTPLMRKAVAEMAALAGDDDIEGRVHWLETAQPFPRLGRPEEVAHTIVFVAKMPFMVGSSIQIDGGYTAQ